MKKKTKKPSARIKRITLKEVSKELLKAFANLAAEIDRSPKFKKTKEETKVMLFMSHITSCLVENQLKQQLGL